MPFKTNIEDSYEFLEVLGKGVSGTVKKAKSKITDQLVAIKLMSKRKIIDETQKDKILKEINILKLCSHPHIIQYIDCYEDLKYYYIVMEYAPGGELFDLLLKKNGLKEEKARNVFVQILSALEYCHGNMIAHRDLKPENILIQNKKDLQVKLADFGFANYIRLDLHDTYCGSLQYVAPEVIQHTKYNPMKTDIWSLGIILYVLLSSKLPWMIDDNGQNVNQIINLNYKIPAEVPDLAADLIKKILVYRSERLTISDIKKHPWVSGYVLPNYLPENRAISKIDCILVDKVVSLGFDKTEVLLSVCENKNTQSNRIYHVLLEKFYGSEKNEDDSQDCQFLSESRHKIGEKPQSLSTGDLKSGIQYSPINIRKKHSPQAKRKTITQLFSRSEKS